MSDEVRNIDQKVYRLSQFFDAVFNGVSYQFLNDLMEDKCSAGGISDRLN